MRMLFGGGPEDVLLVTDVDGDLQQAPNVVIQFFATETGGSAITDLTDINSTPITSVTTSDGGDGRTPGQIAPFYGPDATYEMWAGATGQPRFLMQASRLGDLVGTIGTTLDTHAANHNGHSTTLQDLDNVDATSLNAATDGMTLIYDSTSTSWMAEKVATDSAGYVFEAPAGAVLRAVLRAPRALTVSAVRGFRVGGTAASVNARNGATNKILAVDLSLATASTWTSSTTVQNATLAAGDYLQMEVTGVTGTLTYLVVQVDYQVS
jgi:hypothetical protein